MTDVIGMNTGFEGLRRRFDTRKFTQTTLSNGIPVFMQQPDVVLDDMGIICAFLKNVGSLQDPLDALGCAHFFEHCIYRGTKSKPTKRDLIEPIHSIGGDNQDGSTGHEATQFSIRVPRDAYQLAIETLFEMIFFPILGQSDIEIERGIIEDEYREHLRSPDYLIVETFFKRFFPEQPLGRPVIGDFDSIRRMDEKHIREFHAQHYHAGNLILFCGGSFYEIPEKIHTALEQHFGSQKASSPSPLFIGTNFPFDKHGRDRFVDPMFRKDRTHIVYPLRPRDFEFQYIVSLISEALCGNMTAPLMNELREKRGWLYGKIVDSLEILPGIWYYFYRFPLSQEHFHETESIFFDALRNLTPDSIKAAHQRFQQRRLLEYTPSVDAIKEALFMFREYGDVYPHAKEAQIADAVTFEKVAQVRDWLLKTQPYVFEVTTK